MWQPSVNFPNILQAAFWYKSAFCAAFMCLQFGFDTFWPEEMGANAACKMFVKLTNEFN